MLITAERSLGTSKIGEPRHGGEGWGVYSKKKNNKHNVFFGMLSHPPMATVSSKTLVCAFII